MDQLFVVKRSGAREEVAFDKILQRIKRLCVLEDKPPLVINAGKLVLRIMDQFCDGITTTEIDQLVAEQCACIGTEKQAYSELGARLVVSSRHKTTPGDFADVTDMLATAVGNDGLAQPLISEQYYATAVKHMQLIRSHIDYSKDYDMDYFGMKTLEKSYLMRVDDVIVERPQDLWMRVAIGIHGNDMPHVIETYEALSNKTFTHATPTLFNAGTPRPQLSSCFLLGMEEDSIDGIFDTLKDCALISKWAGGIGLHLHNVRATGTHIRGTNGRSNGIVPMLRVFNMTARYVDQGGGKRNGSFAMYMEPWHADIQEFLSMKKNHGDEEARARDLFYALWIPDLFMQKVKDDAEWHLFCPHECQGLQNVVGVAFESLYTQYVNQNKHAKTIKARELWTQILDSQMETGTPYMLYKDAANFKSNQKNLGVIKSSNLCTEIIEYSNEDETAVCNLASICLPKFVGNDKRFDYVGLHRLTKMIVANLNRVIDINYYPTAKTRKSNLMHRPIGIGVQGLADVFALMKTPFTSGLARETNTFIFETIYHAAVEKSVEIADERRNEMLELKHLINSHCDSGWASLFREVFRENSYTMSLPFPNEINLPPINYLLNRLKPTWDEIAELFSSDERHAGAYSSFSGSPASLGQFQFDLWGSQPSDRYNWQQLREKMMKGMRNSLLVAPMPTASTSQIMGNNECFEPFTNNLYTRRTNAGEFVLVNKHLMTELEELGLWDEEVKNEVVKNGGSIQRLQVVPDDIKERYKTIWEMSMKDVIDMAADRAPFICQSQSMNLWMAEPNYQSLTKMHFYAWEKGLKTGMYYLRRKPAHTAQQFTIAPDEICLHCSS
jgi:ribonucleoside-diphosphate reductase alpha subunit